MVKKENCQHKETIGSKGIKIPLTTGGGTLMNDPEKGKPVIRRVE